MRIVAAVAVIVAASLPASPLAAQDEVVLHEFVYSRDDIGVVLADRPEGVPADDLTVEFEPRLTIRTSGSAVTAVFTDLAFSGSLADGCSSRLAYSASSTEIATVGDGVFDVTMEGYWDWQYTFRAAAGDTGSICESKEQELTGTVTVRMIDGTPFVDDALGIPVPLESFAPEPTPTTIDAGDSDDAVDQVVDEPAPEATTADPDVDTATDATTTDDASTDDESSEESDADESAESAEAGAAVDNDDGGSRSLGPVLLLLAIVLGGAAIALVIGLLVRRAMGWSEREALEDAAAAIGVSAPTDTKSLDEAVIVVNKKLSGTKTKVTITKQPALFADVAGVEHPEQVAAPTTSLPPGDYYLSSPGWKRTLVYSEQNLTEVGYISNLDNPTLQPRKFEKEVWFWDEMEDEQIRLPPGRYLVGPGKNPPIYNPTTGELITHEYWVVR